MKQFIGTKIINAYPMTRQEYNDFRGWELPADENGSDAGYLVEYVDGGKANTEVYAGYVSWSPKEVFDRAYRPVDGMSFGLALEALRKGQRVARRGWNGKGMWIVLMPALSLPCYNTQEPGAKVNDRTAKHIGPDTPLESQPYFAMWTAQGKWQPGWVASQADMLADDWEVVAVGTAQQDFPLDQRLKTKIDQMTYEELFNRRRFDPVGEPLWQGQAGEYALARMQELEKELTPGERVRISKRVGWDKPPVMEVKHG